MTTTRPTSLTQWNAAQQESAEQVDVSSVVAALQSSLRQRGLSAWIHLGLSLEKAHSDGQGLGRTSLKRVLNENQLSVSEVDARAIIRSLTAQDEGRASVDVVKNLLFGPLTGRRLELVQSVFEQLDRKRVGYISTQDVIAAHDAGKHPSVMFGERTPAQVHDEFLGSFQALTRTTGTSFVNLYQWLSYFHCVSGHVPSDEYFELVLKRVWKATTRTSLSDVTTAIPAATPAAVAPMSLLQVLGDSKGPRLTINTSALPPPAPLSSHSASIPQRLHRSDSLRGSNGCGPQPVEVISPKATHTTAEFLKGSQFAACMVDPALRPPTASPRNSTNTAAARVSPRAGASMTTSSPVLDAGTLSVLTRLRTAIKGRGLGGLVVLTREIRLSDADGDGFVTLAEFKRALKAAEEATRVQLSESDLRVLFKYLDRDHRGMIPVGVALDFIREPMNERRLRWVRLAYQALDPRQSLALEPSEVVQRYDAARHPDVIAGRRSEEQVFHEFIENFDLEDAANDRVSPSQWEQYYHNVSFFVPDDELFELLVRNTWQLLHLEAEAAATTSTGSPAATSPVAMEKRVYRGYAAGHNSRQAFAILQPDLGDHHASVIAYEKHGLAHPASPAFASQPYTTTTQSKDLRRIIYQLRAVLKDQGVVGFISLQRKFRLMDDDGNGSISLDEFTRALRDCKIHALSTQDVQNLFHYFDANHDGAIDFNEFLSGIREPMNERRMLFVRMGFDLLDKDHNGVLEVSDIVDVYDARKHPDVLSGRKTEHDVFAEFLESFDVGHHHDGKVTFEEWTRYYQNISACIDDDDYFELMMRNAWHISGGQGWCANSSNRRLLITNADGTATVEEVQNDLGVSKTDAPRVLAQQLGRTPQRTSFYDVLDHSPRPVPSPAAGGVGIVRNKNNASDSIAACLGGGSAGGEPGTAGRGSGEAPRQRRRGSLPPPLVSPSTGNAGGVAVAVLPSASAPAGVQAIIAKLKTSLKARGAHGFCGLSRKFRIMDDDGNGSLNLAEFRKAMRECELELQDADVRLLFQYFDRDRSGSIDLTEFLVGVRDPMSERRMSFVREAFRRMDKDGNGLLEPSDIVDTYDASKHPDVLSGRKSPDDVFREFLETFDVDGVHNGKITWEQWGHYYANISASIDDDDFFELMMRNAWHISGGHGWCENTTNRRVLVTLENGTEVVREIRDDLGVKPEEYQARLQAQEAQAVAKIATTTTLDLTTSATSAPGSKRIISLKDASFAVPLTATAAPATAAPTSSTMGSITSAVPGDALYHALRRQVQSMNVSEIVAIRKRVMHYIDAKTGSISAAQCAEALTSTLSARLTEAHCLALFEYLHQLPESPREVSGTGGGSAGLNSFGARLLQSQNQASRIAVSRLLGGLLGRLSPTCMASVRRVFGALQAAGRGRVFPVAMARSFQAAQHPDVKLGLRDAAAVFQEFAANFELTGAADGTVSLEHFESYCANLRATLCSDEYFDILLRECFVVW